MQAVLFDVGGVLISLQKLRAQACAAFGGVDDERLWQLYNELSLPACRGQESLADCWQRIAARLGVKLPDEVLRSLWIKDFRSSIETHHDVFEIVHRLAGRYRLGIVSNTLAEHAAVHREDRLYDAFDPVVLSHEVGTTKENPAIFDLALDRIGAAPEATVFIDDFELYAKTAASRGIHPIVFRDAASLRSDLERLGVDMR